MKKYERLGEYISEYSVRNKDNEDIQVYSVTNTNGFCTEYFDKDVASKDQTNYKIVPKGYFAYNPSRINVGSIDCQSVEDRVIVSPLYVVFKADERVDNNYLLHYLKSDIGKTYINELASGSVRANLKFSILQEFPFPIIPIEEQKEKMAVIAKIDENIACCDSIIEKLDLAVKSRFIEMFGDPEAGEGKYELQKLRDLSVKISDGVHAKPEYTSEGRPFLSVVNINKGVVDFENCKYVSEEAYQKMIKSTCPEKGDVLYTKVGATYGIPAYIDTEREFCLYVSVCLIKPKHEMINSRFLAIQMGMPSIKHQADARIKGIGVPDLHLNQIGEFDIICPPRNMQDDFVSFVDSIDKSKLAVQEMKNKMEILKASVMQEYFC